MILPYRVILEFLGFTVGSGYYLFLTTQFFRRRLSNPEWAALLSLCAGLAWYAAGAIHVLVEFADAEIPAGPAHWISAAEIAGLTLLLPALLHLAASLATLRTIRQFSGFAYVLLPAILWVQRRSDSFDWVFGVAVFAAIILLLAGSGRDLHPIRRQFRIAFAMSLLLMFAGAAASVDEDRALAVLGGLAPGASLGYFAVRYHLFDLAINLRFAAAVAMGFVAAFYLQLASMVADAADREWEAFGRPVALILVLGLGGVLWVPLYGKMNRILSRRSQIYADFGKRLIQDAVAILDLRERMEFIALQLGKTFELKRVLLATADEREQRIAVFGFPEESVDSAMLKAAGERLRTAGLDAVAGRRSHPEIVRATGFPYVLPLWYERRLVGLLFVDCSPRLSLGDDEAILWGLSRQITHAIESCRLIERKIDLEKELARSQHLAVLGQMAATIAHEVKNPLSSIKTIGTMMQEDESLNEQNRRDLSFIVSETKRLNACVEQLLSFARPKIELRDDVSVSGLLREIARVLTLEKAEHGVTVVPHVVDELVIHEMEPRKLREIVLNLALNAVQASGPGAVVELRAERDTRGGTRITVSDDGPGIPGHLQAKIFEPFFTTKQKGTGLGLPIVAQNVLLLGGEIRVESPLRDGRGTAVTVALPAGVNRNETDLDLAADSQPAG